MRTTAFVDPRDAIATLTRQLGWTLAATSRAVDLDDRFLDRFVREGRPRELAPATRGRLARILDTDERNLMPAGGVGVYQGFYDPQEMARPVKPRPFDIRSNDHSAAR